MPVSPPTRSINDNENGDNISVQSITSDGASARSSVRTMPATSDASSSPLGSLSPAGAESDWVKESSQARSWYDGVTCFGTVSFTSSSIVLSLANCSSKLLGGSVKFFRTPARLKKQITHTKDPVPLALRFRSDATTLLEPTTSEEMGTLDDNISAQLKRLKVDFPLIKIEAYVDHEKHETGCGTQGKKSCTVMPLQLNIYGPDQYLSEVGSFLSNAEMFLQEPVFLPRGFSSYRNPHFLTWDDIPSTPQLLTSNEVSPFDFGMEVEAILNSTNAVPQTCHFQQDRRIRTELKGSDITLLIRSDCLPSNWIY